MRVTLPAEIGAPRHELSLYKRAGSTRLSTVVEVPTVRLDELLVAVLLHAGPIALWIDTEGMAFEVIRGGAGVLGSTRMIHVEVETEPIIGASQKLFSDVERLLRDEGFVLLATDQRSDVLQFNALFIRAEIAREKRAQVARLAHYERLRRKVTRTIVRLMPARLQRALGAQTLRNALSMSARAPRCHSVRAAIRTGGTLSRAPSRLRYHQCGYFQPSGRLLQTVIGRTATARRVQLERRRARERCDCVLLGQQPAFFRASELCLKLAERVVAGKVRNAGLASSDCSNAGEH